MVKYPNEIFEGRMVENLPGIEYNKDDKKTVYAEDMNNANGEIQAIEQTLGENVNGGFDTLDDRLADIETFNAGVAGMITAAIVQAKSQLMPVGTIYGNGTATTDPATLLGFGTWAVYAQGRAIVGLASSGQFNTLGAEMGAETVNLTAAQNGPHNHNFTASSGWANNAGGSLNSPTIGTQTNPSNPFTTGNSGSGAPHNNVQPSKVAALWIRTA